MSLTGMGTFRRIANVNCIRVDFDMFNDSQFPFKYGDKLDLDVFDEDTIIVTRYKRRESVVDEPKE